MRLNRMCVSIIVWLSLAAAPGWCAYHHGGDTDSDLFAAAYPETAGTKLDSCALCHTGGAYESKPGKWVSLGSCQWCHYAFGYDASGDIDATLNPYGRDYRNHGKSAAALSAIQDLDSDGDGYANADEIAAVRFPGDPLDDPSKVPAPYRVYDREALAAMPQHTQFLLMNTHKSGDFYAEYSGVTLVDLLDDAGIRPEAESLRVFAPDGWAQYHPLDPSDDPLFYHVYGPYPPADYYYAAEADEALSPDGWCDYSAPSCSGRTHGEEIAVEGGLQLLLALRRDGDYLSDGVLTEANKLDGEGPFRIVPPQKNPGPPDQRSTAAPGAYLWPFDEAADHNAGYATRSATIIKVDPLPEGTTDIDTAEAGWAFVDEAKIVVYGAIDPLPTIREKLGLLAADLSALDRQAFKRPHYRQVMAWQICLAERLIAWQLYRPAAVLLEKQLMRHVDGCTQGEAADRNDWIVACQAQKRTYWAINELLVLLSMLH